MFEFSVFVKFIINYFLSFFNIFADFPLTFAPCLTWCYPSCMSGWFGVVYFILEGFKGCFSVQLGKCRDVFPARGIGHLLRVWKNLNPRQRWGLFGSNPKWFCSFLGNPGFAVGEVKRFGTEGWLSTRGSGRGPCHGWVGFGVLSPPAHP